MWQKLKLKIALNKDKIIFVLVVLFIVVIFIGGILNIVYTTAYLNGWNDAFNWINGVREGIDAEILEWTLAQKNT